MSSDYAQLCLYIRRTGMGNRPIKVKDFASLGPNPTEVFDDNGLLRFENCAALFDEILMEDEKALTRNNNCILVNLMGIAVESDVVTYEVQLIDDRGEYAFLLNRTWIAIDADEDFAQYDPSGVLRIYWFRSPLERGGRLGFCYVIIERSDEIEHYDLEEARDIEELLREASDEHFLVAEQVQEGEEVNMEQGGGEIDEVGMEDEEEGGEDLEYDQTVGSTWWGYGI